MVSPILGAGIALSDQEALYSPRTNTYNSQTVTILSSRIQPVATGATGGSDEIRTEDFALVANFSPVTDTEAEVADMSAPKDIAVYTVKDGDTIAAIAEMYDISPNTIRWANNIPLTGTVKKGDTIIILPINGVKYTVRPGVTIEKVAKDFGGDIGEILIFNGLEEGAQLVAGSTLIIPRGEIEDTEPVKVATKTTSKTTVSSKGYYARPVVGIESRQHTASHHGVDIAAKTGTPIKAMADGIVMVVKGGNAWNGGYGNLTIIGHANGTQTLYAHQSRIDVKQGQKVTKGQVIGAVGNTGRSTGPHLHFEIRPGKSGINGRAIADAMY
jgi:murein DD-endopeptidase MepM/ murein hydrolase activator NlpD